MRILLVTDWLAGRGGVEAYVSWLREALLAGGDEARLLTSSAGSAADGSADYVAHGGRSPVAQALLQIVNPAAVLETRAAIRDFRPDVIHVHMFENHLSPAILVAMRGTPIVLSIADYKMVCPTNSKLLPDGSLCTVRSGKVCVGNACVGVAHWLRDRPRYRLIHDWPARVDRVLACSDWTRRVLADHDISAQTEPLPARTPPDSFRRRPSPTPRFLYCGRLVREKGLDLLIRAFAELHASCPTAQLRIAGDGPLRAPLRRLAAARGLSDAVVFTGWLTPRALETEFESAWALIAPSLWAEPLGLVAIEAIVRDLPVVASSTGGFAETVRPGLTGLLFPNGDLKELIACLAAIAGLSAFPTHGVDSATRQQTKDAHDPGRHIECLRRIYGSIRRSGSEPSPSRPSASH